MCSWASSSRRIWLSVNDEIRQDADLAEMIWGVSEAIADISTLYTLAPGVGPFAYPGMSFHGSLEGGFVILFSIAAEVPVPSIPIF